MRRFWVVWTVVFGLVAMGCTQAAPSGESASAGAAPAPTSASTAGTATASAAPPAPPEPMDFGPVVIGTAPEHSYSGQQIERGRALVAFGGCNDCHTPWNVDAQTGAPYMDMERMLSGHPQGAPDPYGEVDPRNIGIIGPTFTSFAMPIGITYALNLTPDMETGTGTWTEEMFLTMFREVKHLGGDGRTILPPMPWFNLTSLDDEDLIAIFAYLRSIRPIVNAVPPSKVPEPVIEALGAANQAQLEQMMARDGR